MTHTGSAGAAAEATARVAANVAASEQQQGGSYHSDKNESMEQDTLNDMKKKCCSVGVIDFFRNWRTAIRPWREFLRGSNFGLPLCPGYATQLKTNLINFLPNYFAITVVLMFCSIITSFWLLVSTIILVVLFYVIRTKTAKGPIVVGNEEIPSWILYATAIFLTIPLFIFAHVGYIIYCAVGASIILIVLHASFYRDSEMLARREEADLEAQDEIKEPTPIVATKTILRSEERPMTIPKVQFEDEGSEE